MSEANQANTGGAGRASTTHTVQPGETLSSIAKQHYGDSGQYMKIFEANREILSSPDVIQPGMELKIP